MRSDVVYPGISTDVFLAFITTESSSDQRQAIAWMDVYVIKSIVVDQTDKNHIMYIHQFPCMNMQKDMVVQTG